MLVCRLDRSIPVADRTWLLASVSRTGRKSAQRLSQELDLRISTYSTEIILDSIGRNCQYDSEGRRTKEPHAVANVDSRPACRT